MAKAGTVPNMPAAVLEAYDRLIAWQDGVERKGATMPHTSVN